ncbi:putative ATP-grasp-modified RiPP [Streptomyces sp. NPDC017529]|uniref:putative ATP-grasp-modified RiPP n=1 Tax=Streptomyces sp. NPDC017529 TaxID=3365000 RepID=UPI0037B1BC7F
MSRLAPYPNSTQLPYSSLDIDPASQTSQYFTADGLRLDMPKHGTGTDTATQTQTGGDGGGKYPPAPQDDDLIHDTDSD